ncbi:MAG TPA: hypothetical protein GXZ51_00230 [Acholeplasma sp.]|jgi:hypothetical protein|nr:hypothetical protein [Acholeplasma sp.]
MISKIGDHINANEGIIIAFACVLALLEIVLIFKRKRFPFVTFFFTLFAVISMILHLPSLGLELLFGDNKIEIFETRIDVIIFIFAYGLILMAVQIAILVNMLVNEKKDSKLIEQAKLLHPECQGVIRGKRIIFLESYYQKLPYKQNEIKVAKINNEKVRKNKFYRALKEKDVFLLYLELKNKVLEVNYKKENIIVDEEVVGKAIYVNILKEGKKDEYVKLNPFKVEDLVIYANLQKEITMFFDQEINSYRLSENMAHLLGTKEIITEKAYQEIILASDLPIYLNKEFSKEKPSTYNYRVNSINGIDWVEQSTFFANGRYYDIIKLAKRPQTHYHYLGLGSLEEALKQAKDKKIALVLLSFTSLRKYLKQDQRLFESIVHEYFQNVLKEETIYKLANLEYAFLIEDKEVYDALLLNLNNEASKLLEAEVYVYENKYEVKNNLAVILNTDLAPDEDIIKEGLDLLALSKDAKFNKPYSIYVKKEVVVPEAGYDFKSLKIDLNDDDLDEYL